jgi:hypothetical protein
MKAALSMMHLIFGDLIFASWDCQRRSLDVTWHYSIFYHKRQGVAVRCNHFAPRFAEVNRIGVGSTIVRVVSEMGV